ncbi:hypothetical protein Daura_45245 [Dactylosporangium aurantiacum]|uniref:Uncharacterized protein n=2 Tax=Dactylosporangium aurantiacum TaxID=35754 RepID=A0A9Q9MGD6_9ACTN|nr:hypothetical protein [Dactylosporangium aurantiacum]UWZ53650.1 hypothetical protein Daura_45245 [Dactylosporangium aurantiacum]
MLLEGRDLEELLAQVRAEHGPDAVIVSAEKVRTGGVGGLFGTQKYELTVEVPDSAATTQSSGPDPRNDDTPKRSLSIQDLAALADAAEAQGRNPTFADVLAGAREGAWESAAEHVREGAPPNAGGGVRPPGAGGARPPGPPGAGGPPSAGGVRPPGAGGPPRPPTAADALNRLLADAPPAEAPSGAPSVRPFRPAANQPIAKLGVRQVNADPRFEQRPETPRPQRFQPPPVDPRAAPGGGDPRRRVPPPPDPPRPQLSDPETDFWQESPMPVEATATVEKPRTPDASERLAGAYNPHTAAQAAERAAAERPAAAAATERAAADRAATTAAAAGAAPAAGAQAAPAAPASPASPASSASPASPASVAERAGAAPAVTEKPERQAALGRRLQSLGVPSDIAFRATAADTYTAVVDAFSALPLAEPAPDGPGETLIVVGESTHAVDVARWVAESQRLDTSHILFAGRNAAAAGIDPKRRITGAHDARLWAKKLRKSDSPSVVAVEAALDESAWAAAIVEAVRPVAVWVVVDASRKTSDVAHHLQGLRRVDAICLRGTLSSGDPASPLSLRLPVALLDGRPSTPFQWAAMLCERLSLVG